jgi:hypothetical protein
VGGSQGSWHYAIQTRGPGTFLIQLMVYVALLTYLDDAGMNRVSGTRHVVLLVLAASVYDAKRRMGGGSPTMGFHFCCRLG